MEEPTISVNLYILNFIMPYIGLLLCSYIMFSKRFCTQRRSTSTLIISIALVWLGLIWNDVGSEVFVPSRQTISSRVLLINFMIVLIYDLAGSTKLKRQLQDELDEYKSS